MREIDRNHTDYPTTGVIGMRDHIRITDFGLGVIRVNEKRIRRLMRLMGLETIYPKKSLSSGGNAKYVVPYLLRRLEIDHKNHVWSTDISYIPMAHGFMFLIAIIDVYSRAIMAWGLYNTMEKENVLEVLDNAINAHGTPEIINSDQGSQFTSPQWFARCAFYGIKVSMDGRGRCKDNIWIERFWRSIKQEYIYINPADTVAELKSGIKNYIEHYNNKRPHQGIDHQIPMERYEMAA